MKEDADVRIAVNMEYMLDGADTFTVLWWNTSV